MEFSKNLYVNGTVADTRPACVYTACNCESITQG